MQIDDLVRAYQAKTDEELLQLVNDPTQLTPEAVNVLNGELAKRRITLAPKRGEEPQAKKRTPQEIELPSSNIPAKKFLTDVLAIYSNHFWLFFKMALPTVFASWCLNTWRLRELPILSRRFAQHLGELGMWPALLEMGLVTWGTLFVSWTLFSGLFVAISAATRQIEASALPSFMGSLTIVGRRFRQWFAVARIHFLLFVLLAFIAVALFSVFARLRLAYRPPAFLAVFCALIAAFVFVLSRFALNIPAAILDEVPVKQSFSLSYRLTRGKERILASLLAKSIIGGYIGAFLPFWIARWMWPPESLPTSSHSTLIAVSILSVSAVEPVMFIGFALLYLRMTVAFQPAREAYSIG
ncbi:MAG: hypothetical protein ABSE92_14080 [Terriglobales bacterium]|jgi:hypothetical protein